MTTKRKTRSDKKVWDISQTCRFCKQEFITPYKPPALRRRACDKCVSDFRKSFLAKRRNLLHGGTISKDHLERMSIARKQSKAFIEWSRICFKEIQKKHPHMRRGVQNHACKEWFLRSPSGVSYHFKNMRDFVLENRNLFLLTDKQKNIESGLMSLRSTRGSWKGWTWDKTYSIKTL